MAEVYLTGGASWLNDYAKTLSDGLTPSNNKVTRVSSKYYTDRDSEIYKKAAALSYRENIPDSVLEIALATYYTSAINIRPVESDKFLPANDPREADLKLGKEVYQEMQALRFLGNTASVGRYEGMLKFIIDRGKVSEADIKKFMAKGIAEEVDAQFNRVSFMIDRNYNAVLTRNPQTGQYKLSYEGVGHVANELPIVSSLEALSSEMSKSGDFSATAFNEVRAQAALIPAVVIAQGGQTEAVQGTITKAITDFYLEPTPARYNVIRDIDVLFIKRAYEFSNDPFFAVLSQMYGRLLVSLSKPISEKISSDTKELPSVLALTQTQVNALTVKR
ncbi:hypothetical protein NO1_1067 [Candidatus Termititenax aidoneus]|uniref:Uncharacterized protein n=1 Tax=Termititenax aidoneus TaxID=2218524 RepID=A0A388TAK8_TERA1|nr:hypothetical protein NO1_1067 [Candidatus Termititenax aidoneus]